MPRRPEGGLHGAETCVQLVIVGEGAGASEATEQTGLCEDKSGGNMGQCHVFYLDTADYPATLFWFSFL